MEAIINVLKASKSIWIPLLTTFVGACLAFQFNFFLLRRKEKNEQIANLNYLGVTLHNFLTEMSYLDSPVEHQLQEVKKIKKIYNDEGDLPLESKPILLQAFAEIAFVKPLTEINIANYVFADKNTAFINSIIKMVRSVEDIALSFTSLNSFVKKFIDNNRQKPPFADFNDFLDLHIKHLEHMRIRVLQTVDNIRVCDNEMVNYNRKYLHYKITNIPMTENLRKLFSKAEKFV